MGRLLKSILLIFSVLFLSASIVFAEEITITTYYPSPYGSYNELTTKSNTYLATTSGVVGIGTTVPAAKLHIFTDPLSLDSLEMRLSGYEYWDFDIRAWDGMGADLMLTPEAQWSDFIINTSGNVGIGTAAPESLLTLRGANKSISIGDDDNNKAFIQWFSSQDYLRIQTVVGGAIAGNIVLQQNGGNVGIGRVPTTYKLEVEGDASKTAAGSWQANSDQRIKKDISSISDAVSTLNLVRPVKFKYTDEYKAQHPSIQDKYYYNFIAQEFQKVFPTEVTVTNDTLPNGEHILAIDPYVLTPYLVKAVQEQQKEIESLKSEVEKLKAKPSK